MQQSANKTMFAEARNQPQFEVDTSYINHYLLQQTFSAFRYSSHRSRNQMHRTRFDRRHNH